MGENKEERKLEVVANERKMTSKDQETKCDSNSRRNMTGELGYSAAVGGVRQNGITSL